MDELEDVLPALLGTLFAAVGAWALVKGRITLHAKGGRHAREATGFVARLASGTLIVGGAAVALEHIGVALITFALGAAIVWLGGKPVDRGPGPWVARGGNGSGLRVSSGGTN